MRIYQRTGVWYIDYSFNGRRVRKRVGTSKKMAELALKNIEVKIAKKEFLGIRESQKVRFEKLCEEYLEYSKSNKTERSYLRDQTNVKSLLNNFSGKLVSEITAHDLEIYKNQRREKVKPASVNRELSCIKHMFTKAIEWGYTAANPLRAVMKFKEPPGRDRYLAEDEEERLMNCCSEHTKQIVVMALNTGMRRGEMLNLKWSDINLKTRMIIIRKSKNNEMRMIPINNTLYSTLIEIGPQLDNDYVFADDSGKPFVTIKTGFKAALRRAGIKDFRFHDLRHTFASRLVMSGVDIRTVQQLMGHKDIRMTMRYSHLSNAHLREAIKKLEHGTNLAQTTYSEVAVFAKH